MEACLLVSHFLGPWKAFIHSCDFSFLCYLSLWDEVLEEVNHTQKFLQISGISFEKSVNKFRCLKLYLQDDRKKIVENAIQYATDICDEMNIPIERRGRRQFKKTMPGEIAKDAGLTLQQELKRAMFECVDHFPVELEARSKSIELF